MMGICLRAIIGVVSCCVFFVLVQKAFQSTRLHRAPAGASGRRSRVDGRIPRLLWQTSSLTPETIPDLLKDFARGYDRNVLNDDACRHFLKAHFPEIVLTTFDGFQRGAHKADLWRYCVLYVHGGVYMDIKTVPLRPLSKIFVSDNCWYTCLCHAKTCIYQGLIATPAKNDIFLRLIEHCVANPVPSHYHLFTEFMLEEITRTYGRPSIGRNKGTAPLDLVLFEERCGGFSEADMTECQKSNTITDRYDFCCNGYSKDDDAPFVLIRDPEYPWAGHE